MQRIPTARTLSACVACSALALVLLPPYALAQTNPTTPRANTTQPTSVAPTSNTTPGSTAVPGSSNLSVPPAPPTETTPATSTVPLDAARSLTLSDVLSIARRDPPTVLAAIAQLRAAEVQPIIARAALLPTVTGSAGANFQLSNGAVSISGLPPMQVTNISGSLQAAVTMRWTIWDFGRTSRAVDAAQAAIRTSQQSLRNIRRTAMANAAGAFYVLMLDQALQQTARETLAARERQLEVTRNLVQAGARPPIEATRAEVARDSAQLDVMLIEATVNNDAASLANALALDPTTVVRASPGTPLDVDDDPNRAGNEAISRRPEVALVRAQLAQSEAQLRSAWGGYLPSITASASGSVQYTERFNGTGSGPSETASAQVAFTVPIYDPVTNANVRLAEANVATARANVISQELAIRTDAVQAALAVRSARQTLAQAERLAAGAHANLEQAEGRYAAGAAPMLELIDAQAADVSARVTLIRARMQLELSRIRLLAAQGRLEDMGTTP